jgi:hypothetical protein
MRGAPGDKGGIDPSKVKQIYVFADSSKTPQSFEVQMITDSKEFRPLTADTFIPFIDQFGQFIHSDWPGKTHSLEELQQRKQDEEKQLAENPGPGNWDNFGGYNAGPKLNATGFFRVEKYQGNWWLVAPNGNLFWSNGINCVRMADSTPISGREKYFANLPEANSLFSQFYGSGNWAPQGYYKTHIPYKTYDFARANLMQKYGNDWQQLSGDIAHKRLRNWGLNTIANWSSESVYLMRKTPYAATIRCNAKKSRAPRDTGKNFTMFSTPASGSRFARVWNAKKERLLATRGALDSLSITKCPGAMKRRSALQLLRLLQNNPLKKFL